MKQLFSEENSVAAVNERITGDVPPRVVKIMQALVTHLHAFVKEVGLTQAEWEIAIDFLTRTGQICSADRQEFILLSDTLGVSMLVDAINNQRPPGATQNTVLGPFHVTNAPLREMNDNISLDGVGEQCLFEGKILNLEGHPIGGAELDVWCDNSEGFYDVQQPDIQPKWNNRGRFITGGDGEYRFLGVRPVPYPIPYDGPVGEMLTLLGRLPYRPAHMHFIVNAPGYEKIVTHTFAADDPHLASDAVFGVKGELVTPYTSEDSRDGTLIWRTTYDFVMVPKRELSPNESAR